MSVETADLLNFAGTCLSLYVRTKQRGRKHSVRFGWFPYLDALNAMRLADCAGTLPDTAMMQLISAIDQSAKPLPGPSVDRI
jgi:hypothetical protein